MKELNIRELQDRLDAIAIEEENEFDRIESKKLKLISKSRPEVTVSMVAPALEDLLAEYEDEVKGVNFVVDIEKVKKDITKRTHVFMKKRK